MRWHRLGERSLWEDELSTWTSIRGTVMDGIRYVQMPHPPLYSLSCRVAAWGEPKPSEARLRLPAALYGAAAALAGGALGAVMFGRRVGWAALIVFAFNAFLLKYSREARMYSLLALTTTVSMLCWYALVTRRGRRAAWGAGYILSTTAMLYSHYFAPLALAAQAAWWAAVVTLRRRAEAAGAGPTFPLRDAEHDGPLPDGRGSAAGGGRRYELACLTLPVLLYAPLAVFFVRHVLPNKLGWIQPAPWWAYPHFLGDAVLGLFDEGGAGSTATRWAHVSAGVFVAAALLCGAVPRLGARGVGATQDERDACPGRLLLLFWVVFVVGGLGAISLVSNPVFVPRYAITALVPGTLAVLTLPVIRGSRALIGAAALLLVGNAPVAVTECLEESGPDGLAGIIRHLNDTLGPEDAVVVVDFPFCPNYRNPVEMGFEYYGLRDDLTVLRMRGEQKRGQLTDSTALSDPRRLHIVTLLGDFDATLRATGRRVDIYALPPYRYFIVHPASGNPGVQPDARP
ncbi:MAG: hypothetical protein FLDDKLPJ_02522 [Phycisphaerae bacterium]|nr:hypothetical protein [Phycisphaerae bacterium]